MESQINALNKNRGTMQVYQQLGTNSPINLSCVCYCQGKDGKMVGKMEHGIACSCDTTVGSRQYGTFVSR